MADEPRKFQLLAGTAFAVSASLFFIAVGALNSQFPSGARLWDALFLAVLAIVGEELSVEFSERITLSASNLPILLAIIFLGPTPTLIVAAIVGTWGSWNERTVAVVGFNIANSIAPAFLGAVVFASLHRALGFALDQVTWGLLLAGAAANAVNEISNVGLTGIAGRLKYGLGIAKFWRNELLPFVRSLGILTALGLTVVALYAKAGIIAVVLLFVPLFAAQYMFKLLVREKEHVVKQKELSDQYLEMNISLAAAMVVLLDSKDEYTASHSAAVAMFCRDIAIALEFPEADVEALHLAGLLHDLGKVGTPDAILQKEGSLDEDEWEFIRQHPAKGAEVLAHLAAYQNVADIVQYHHERLDGTGYPNGASGDEIPEMSKILAVADTYHAMTSDRPYHAAISSFEALKELRRLAGTKLDSRYIEILASVLRDKNLAYRDGTSTDFMDEYRRGRANSRLRGNLPSVLPASVGAQGVAETQG